MARKGLLGFLLAPLGWLCHNPSCQTECAPPTAETG
jgi:hypothetical protein